MIYTEETLFAFRSSTNKKGETFTNADEVTRQSVMSFLKDSGETGPRGQEATNKEKSATTPKRWRTDCTGKHRGASTYKVEQSNELTNIDKRAKIQKKMKSNLLR
jgi:hypothetical protein